MLMKPITIDHGDAWFEVSSSSMAVTDHSRPPSLISYPEPLDSFLASAFTRGSFVAIQAGEKIGKSLWLMDIAYRAMKSRCKVAYFEAGDHTEDQFRQRLTTRVTGCSARDGSVPYPKSLTIDEDKNPVLVNEERESQSFSMDHFTKSFQRLEKRGSMRCHFSLAGMLGCEDIRSMLDVWNDEGWKPDVVVVDYADIMSVNPRADRRDSINETWIGLRAISQEWNSLVVTATQADARSYDRAVMSKSNFSEDKRKMAHVTDFMGLVRPRGIEETNLTRLNFIVRRNEAYSEAACCYVAGCPELGRPVVLSSR